MKKLTDKLTDIMGAAFEKAGYDAALGAVRVSDRPDLCQYQCNGAMAAAKKYHKAPFMIADEVAAALDADAAEAVEVSVVKPGFLNLNLKPAFLLSCVQAVAEDENLSIPKVENPKKIVIDYGGPNVAKPLHVGHLRAAVIGESVKRLCRTVGNEVLGDVHLGDWGLQMGLIITEMKHRNPELPYFTDSTEYPEEAPFTISELEEIYPAASAKSKEDEEYKKEALEATHQLQLGNPGYRALWNQILSVSIADLKRNYERLNVSFDLWKSESDAQPYIPAMVEDLKNRGIAFYDQGALVVDVTEPDDKKEIPPCIILKSDGASLYSTTDIATIVERKKLFNPDEIIYVVDKRQGMHFTQVFRTVRKAGIVSDETGLTHIGFGTMNGKDGKPFKTRDGGVMRLSSLLDEIETEMKAKIRDNDNVRDEDTESTAEKVALAAVKYGDLSNQASKDYVFDVEKFTSFEGNTGPYILYTIVRIRSILEKAAEGDLAENLSAALLQPETDAESALMLDLAVFGSSIYEAYEELAPHRICSYIYQLSNDFNRFYHGTRILGEEDAEKRRSYLALLSVTLKVLEKSIDILGFDAPAHM
ncbi:MAG: arginine--tRNA ligase [Lachnospiraceae bacterium]|nr:arginine--tRNA ligase [Lachnospiraceae bacterium]